jgi:hypothetical protein
VTEYDPAIARYKASRNVEMAVRGRHSSAGLSRFSKVGVEEHTCLSFGYPHQLRLTASGTGTRRDDSNSSLKTHKTSSTS